MEIRHITDNISVFHFTGSSNIYLLHSEENALIDSGHELTFDNLQKALDSFSLSLSQIQYLLTTHSHGDHVGNHSRIKKTNPQIKIIGSIKYKEYQQKRKIKKLLVGAEDQFSPYLLDEEVKDQDEIKIGNLEFRIIDLPGHTPDSIGFFLPGEKILFSGDCLYEGFVSQVDYYQDMEYSAQQLLRTYQKILDLEIIKVLPGHGPEINDIHKKIQKLIKKLNKLTRMPEFLVINNLIPSFEYYIHKNPGYTKDQVIEFFVKNIKMMNDPIFKKIDNHLNETLEKLLSLMSINDMIYLEGEKIFLKNKLNYLIS
ncbi:MAG: MBL fold metallo-hydrolase [Spirochaetes bacterium]|nr:MBL fold metallo-hydrolase [Spirochaetota bacterium]